MLIDSESVEAGCLLARSTNPFNRRMISLPFSDFCPPLASDQNTRDALLGEMAAAMRLSSGLEVRGVSAPYPWHTRHHFCRFTLNLRRPFDAIERAADREVRRHMRRARSADVRIDVGTDTAAIRPFFKMQLESRRRLGMPSQPLRFFQILRDVYASIGCFEVWTASQANRPVAAAIILRDRNILHVPWLARVKDSPDGASHLLLMTLAERYAGRMKCLDLGRTDTRNRGLMRFKRDFGTDMEMLPYSYYPTPPRTTNAQDLSGGLRIASQVWRKLPMPVAQALGPMMYRLMA
jgi:hypothetical protein